MNKVVKNRVDEMLAALKAATHPNLSFYVVNLCLFSLLLISIGCKNSDVPFATNSYCFKKTTPTDNLDVEAEINVDFPISGNTELKENIIAFILEALTDNFVFDEDKKNHQYNGDTSDGQSIVDHFGNEKIKELQAMGIGEARIFINKILETEKYVSYLVDFSGNAGGTGLGLKYGATFDKNSGERLQLIKDPNNIQFKDFLIGKVEGEIISKNKENLLFKSELTNHPFPEYPPFMTKNGVCFIYQKGEIGAGLLGQVEVTIMLDFIAEYLSDSFVKSNDDNTKDRTVSDSIKNDYNEKKEASYSNPNENKIDNLDWLQGHWVYRQTGYEAHLVIMENTVRQYSTLNPDPTYYTFSVYENKMYIKPIKNDGTDFVVTLDPQNKRIDYGDGNWMRKIK